MNRIVIGSSREQKIASLVLEHTILKNASEPVQVLHTYDKVFPSPTNPRNISRTGFSFNRFAIPQLLDYHGVGAYLECDQIVFGDVKELFSIPFNGATILRPSNQPSVLLLDCARLRWDVGDIVRKLDAGAYSYQDLMVNTCVEPAGNIRCSIPNEWNSLERYDPEKTKLLHYTNMSIQPWRRWGHPLGSLWMKELKSAMRAKAVTLPALIKDVEKKYVVPEVLREARAWS